MGHVRMMAAVQPFLSGAISKTVNMPESATVEDIEEIYCQGWKLGLKALAIYRDNCKVGQPLSDAQGSKKATAEADAGEQVVEYRPIRKRLPKKRPSETVSFSVGGAEGYLTASSYPDDGLGEVFLKMSKQGSTLAGVMDAFSIAISIGLQYGVPLETYVAKFTNMRFEPAGMTDDPDIRMAASVMDYIFRRLALDFLPYETPRRAGHLHRRPSGPRTVSRGRTAASGRGRRPWRRCAPAAPVETQAGDEAEPPAPAEVGSSTELLERCRARPPTRRSASPAAPRCARPAAATSARAAAPPAAAAETAGLRSRPLGRLRGPSMVHWPRPRSCAGGRSSPATRRTSRGRACGC